MNEPFSAQALEKSALRIRERFLEMHFRAKSGHLGSGLSAIDLLAYLYKTWLKPGDRFVLSKGHAASALYATLNHVGLLSDHELATYYQDGTLLPAHPAARALEAIPAATGSLGHGLSIVAGMAFSSQVIFGDDKKYACLLSDGECNEGAVWEAAMFAAHHKLRNLTVIVDKNGLQGFGKSDEVLSLGSLAQKWEAFGFATLEIDGHDFNDIHRALAPTAAAARADRPLCVVANTVKGKGVRFMENKLEWHYLPLTEAQYAEAKAELRERDATRRPQ